MKTQVFEPVNVCANPDGKCYFPNTKHRACGSDYIYIEKMVTVQQAESYFNRLRK